jgi:hypothetical protein
MSRSARWMALPAAVLLLAMIGMALSASPEPERTNTNSPNQSTELNERQLDEDTNRSGDEISSDTFDSPSVTVSSSAGDVEIRFDPDGVARASVDGGTTEVDLVQGTESGLRLTDDGGLEPVLPGQVGPNDLGFLPTSNGVDVLAPDNPTIELRPDGAFGGVSATEFDDGNANSLTPDSGVVELNDGTTITPIEAPGDGLLRSSPSGPMPWRWIFTTIAALAITSATIGFLLHRNYTEADLRAENTPDATRVDENYDQFLARLASDENPTRAIRLGFHAVEQGLGGLPSRQENETPFEWHQRVGKTIPTVEEPLGRICDLFAKARFAPGDATTEDRQQMIVEIRSLITDVHTPTPMAVVGDSGIEI